MKTLIAIIAPLAAVVLATFLYLTKSLGHRVTFTSLGFFYIDDLSYITPLRIITVRNLGLNFKRPSRSDPSWASISTTGVEYKDAWCHATVDYCLTKLWFFPMFYRFSFGPWVDTTVDGVAMHVYDSRNTPALVDGGRHHLVASVLNGETVRIGLMSTKFFFGRDAIVPQSYASGSEEEHEGAHGGMQGGQESPTHADGTKVDGRQTANVRDDVRIRFAVEQWHMMTFNHRMYTFGGLQGELRRSYLDHTGSMVLIMQDVAWTKLPHTDYPHGRGRGKLWEIFRAMWYFPSDLFTLARDPLALVDVHVGRCDVTFCNFRLRDAEMLKQGTIRLKQEHFELEKRRPGIINDFAWSMFVHGVYDLCKE